MSVRRRCISADVFCLERLILHNLQSEGTKNSSYNEPGHLIPQNRQKKGKFKYCLLQWTIAENARKKPIHKTLLINNDLAQQKQHFKIESN